jgi:hypothetical protein
MMLSEALFGPPTLVIGRRLSQEEAKRLLAKFRLKQHIGLGSLRAVANNANNIQLADVQAIFFRRRHQPSKPPLARVGVLAGAAAEGDPYAQAFQTIFRQTLHQLGWTEGRNVRYEYQLWIG